MAGSVPTRVGASAQPLLVIDNVFKRYGSLEVLKGVSFSVMPGDVVCVLGPSGGGKSTLLRCINHLEKIEAGRILVGGELVGYRQVGDLLYELSEPEIRRKRTEIGMVFQSFNLFPHMTALENILEAPIRVKGEPREIVTREAMALLARMGLQDKAHSYPRQLSGGQQQRVAIARALAMKPRLMLFDEPTSALDPELVGEVLDSIRQLAADGMTMVVVTHEVAFARDVADNVVFMDGGRVVEVGTPAELIANPREDRTREFLGRIRR